MKPLLFFAVSICCEDILLPAFMSIPAVTLRQSLPVLLTSTAACTRSTGENGRTHRSPLQSQYRGQQCIRSRQQVAYIPNEQQPYSPPLLRQHLCSGQCEPSGHRFCKHRLRYGCLLDLNLTYLHCNGFTLDKFQVLVTCSALKQSQLTRQKIYILTNLLAKMLTIYNCHRICVADTFVCSLKPRIRAVKSRKTQYGIM